MIPHRLIIGAGIPGPKIKHVVVRRIRPGTERDANEPGHPYTWRRRPLHGDIGLDRSRPASSIPLRKAKTSSLDWAVSRTALRPWYSAVSAFPPLTIRSFASLSVKFCVVDVAGCGLRWDCAVAEGR